MKTIRAFLAVLLLALCATGARASIITFTLTGVPGISGYVQYDSAAFHGFSFDYVPNSAIVGINVDVFGTLFDLADLVNIPGFSAAFLDTAGPVPRILNGFGWFAYDGTNAIAFYPDGFDGTALDGDAALSFQPAGASFTYAVRWVATTAPEPATTALVLLGLAALGVAARRAA